MNCARKTDRTWHRMNVPTFVHSLSRRMLANSFVKSESPLIFTSFLCLELVSWCFEPSQPQRITSGLTLSERKPLDNVVYYLSHRKQMSLYILLSISYPIQFPKIIWLIFFLLECPLAFFSLFLV